MLVQHQLTLPSITNSHSMQPNSRWC